MCKKNIFPVIRTRKLNIRMKRHSTPQSCNQSLQPANHVVTFAHAPYKYRAFQIIMAHVQATMIIIYQIILNLFIDRGKIVIVSVMAIGTH